MRDSPTLLEVVAAENFVASLYSAISQLLDLILTFGHQQQDFTFIRKHRCEIAALLHFCFELNSFSRHSSSSGERLYDIRRISSSKVFGLSKKQVSISAIHTTLPLYLQNMKENYFMTKRKPKVLKLQSNDSQDNSMQGVNLAFANSCELFIRDILPAVFFLLETSKLRIWFNFVIGSRKTHNLTCSYFLFHLVRSESARSTRSSYDFHILTALAAATKCCEWYFSSASTITYDKKAQLPKCGEVSSALKSIPKHPKGLSFQDFNRCCPLCLNKRVGPTLLIRSGTCVEI